MSCSYPCRKPCKNPLRLGNQMCNFHIKYLIKKNQLKPEPQVVLQSVQHEHKFKEEYCAVCTDKFETNFTPLNPCGHYIHNECVVNSGKEECPICRSKVILSEEDKKKTNEVNKNFKRENNDEYERQLINIYGYNQLEYNGIISIRTLFGTQNTQERYNRRYWVNGRLQREERWENDVLQERIIYWSY